MEVEIKDMAHALNQAWSAGFDCAIEAAQQLVKELNMVNYQKHMFHHFIEALQATKPALSDPSQYKETRP